VAGKWDSNANPDPIVTSTTTDSRTPIAPNVGTNERVICALGGLLIAGYGLTRRNASTPILSLIGGLLIKRGLTGQCEVYQKLGVDTTGPR
jgi:uncharacterized membrane protein